MDVVSMLVEANPEVGKKKFQRVINLMKIGHLNFRMNDTFSYVIKIFLKLIYSCIRIEDYCNMVMDGADNKVKQGTTFTENDYILFCSHVKFVYEFKQCADIMTDVDMWKLKTTDGYFDGMYQA